LGSRAPRENGRCDQQVSEHLSTIRRSGGLGSARIEPDLQDAFPEMRAKGILITIRGTAGCQILADLVAAPSDPVIIKKRYSAFFGTNLDEILNQLQPDSIVLAGINTHACVRMTAIDAYQRDWPVILASDCIDSYDRAHHEVTLRYMKDKIAAVLTNEEIQAALTPGK
jgi:nicotinamidase-related amidase